jgi:MEMO1 family protein
MATTTSRHAAVAGQFYPRSAPALLAEIESYFLPEVHALPALGCIAPHAGYMYSGHVAGAVYSHIKVPRLAILLCPNHTGMGHPLSIMSEGSWETPLGSVPIDSDLSSALRSACPLLIEDQEAHRAEHAIEVQLPFLQARQPAIRFVPIAVGTGDYGSLETLGKAAGAVIADSGQPVLLVASSDMNHYESDSVTRAKDHQAIERVLALDPAGLYEVVNNENISMCGYGPAIVMLTAARRLGAKSAELIRYATSGDVSGDRRMVVGYAGIVIR